jgi:hypothetical protein
VTRLCVLFAALAVIARARVAVLPGWVVPLPVLLVAAQVVACLTLLAWLMWRILQRQAAPADDPAGPEPAAGAAGGRS